MCAYCTRVKVVILHSVARRAHVTVPCPPSPQDRIAAAVEAQLARDEALSSISKKAQYYERMQLKDEEFAFVDEAGLPTVETVGEFTTTVRVLSLDTDELLQLRDWFRKIKVCVCVSVRL